MPVFKYTAQAETGRFEENTVEANNLGDLRSALTAQGLKLVKVVEVSGGQLSSANLSLNPSRWLSPRSLDVEMAFSQISVMLRGGLTLLLAIRTAAEQTQNQSLGRKLNRIADRIQDGSSFHGALQEHKCFPEVAVQLARVGEETGMLDQVLNRAAAQMEQKRKIVTSLLTALAYPMVVAVAALGVSAYLVIVVIPELQKFLGAMGRQLPAMTQFLLDISGFLQTHGLMMTILLVTSVLSMIVIYNWAPGRLWIDRQLLRVPLIGRVLRLAGTASFASAFAVLIQSGITVLDALRTTEQLHRNRFLAQCISNARDAVMRGETLSQPLSVPNAYMPMLPRMIAVAENTGELDEILTETAKFHEEQLQAAIRRLSALVEPLIILVVGGIVGFVYISFFVALFSVGGAS